MPMDSLDLAAAVRETPQSAARIQRLARSVTATRPTVADWTEHHDGAWHVRVHVKDDSLGHREVWCRFPDQVRFRPAS